MYVTFSCFIETESQAYNINKWQNLDVNPGQKILGLCPFKELVQRTRLEDNFLYLSIICIMQGAFSYIICTDLHNIPGKYAWGKLFSSI